MSSRRRPPLVVVSLLAAGMLAAPAGAATRLAAPGSDVVALTVAGRSAVALIDPGEEDGPFAVVKASGGRARRIAVIGSAGAEFGMLASDARGRVVAAWDHPISGGVRFTAQAVGSGTATELQTGTGPGRLAIGAGGSAVVACPDVNGDVAVTTTPDIARPRRDVDPGAEPATDTLTATAPEERHFAVGMALGPRGPLVLDLAQRRRRSELRVVGEGAPVAPLTGVGALRQLEGAIAVSGNRVAVAYVSSGRPVLATAMAGRAWRRRVLPGSGVSGTPAVAIAGGRTFVAWSQPGVAGRRDVRVAAVGTRVALRRLTGSMTDDEPPLLAAGPSGRVFAAWASARGTARTPLLARLR